MKLPWAAMGRVLLGSVIGLALLGMAIPGLPGASPYGRAGADQNAAAATLHVIHAAQVRFRAEGCADRDGDGKAEFGSFAMLAGAEPCPPGDRLWDPVGLSPKFAEPRDGIVTHANYRLQLFLPARHGGWVPAGSAEVDAQAAAKDFLALAWPIAGRGKGAMYVCADGIVQWHANADRRFEAPARPLRPGDCTPANGFVPRQ